MDFLEALRAGEQRGIPAVGWLVRLLESEGEQQRLLLHAADRLRAVTMGEAVHLRGLNAFRATRSLSRRERSGAFH